jgi:hypothetical protein
MGSEAARVTRSARSILDEPREAAPSRSNSLTGLATRERGAGCEREAYVTWKAPQQWTNKSKFLVTNQRKQAYLSVHVPGKAHSNASRAASRDICVVSTHRRARQGKTAYEMCERNVHTESTRKGSENLEREVGATGGAAQTVGLIQISRPCRDSRPPDSTVTATKIHAVCGVAIPESVCDEKCGRRARATLLN